MLSSRPRMITSSPSVVDSWRSVATTDASRGTGAGISARLLLLGFQDRFALAIHVLPEDGDHVAAPSERVGEAREVLEILARQVAELRAGRQIGGKRRELDIRRAAGLPGAIEVVDEAIPQPLRRAPVTVHAPDNRTARK